MLELVREALGVYRSARSLVHVSRRHAFFLKKVSEHTPERHSRILLHQDGDKMHQTMIFYYPGSENEMHAHDGPESMLVISGKMKVEFEDRPSVYLVMHELLWIPAGVRHKPTPHEWTVILETVYHP